MIHSIKFICLVPIFFILASCTSINKKIESKNPQNQQVPRIEEKTTTVDPLDMQSIQRLLGLERNLQSLGYQEQRFNTCKVGFGYDTGQNCQEKFFVVIHFKIACRASEGTISTILTADDLAVVANQNLQWFLKQSTGQVHTDSNGLAEIRMISNSSQKTERLRLSNGIDFLLMRAGEINSLIVPINWCN